MSSNVANSDTKNRDMAGKFYDVIIVGGGIHGAGIAQACAAAGYHCLLLEKQDWAWATSSRSSKLLHGGLRYLQTGQLKLVHECLQERERLLRNAPTLAHINWFYLPVYQDSHYPPWKIHAGLWLYRLLTGFTNPHGQFRKIPASEWHTLDGLSTKNLQAVFAYQDGQTDDKLLTRAVVTSAQELGCDTWNHAEVLAACQNNSGWLVDVAHGHTVTTLQCQLLVNASGPWVNDVIQRCNGKKQLPVDLVQGTHVVLQHAISHRCFYLEAPDRRAIFVLPWHGKTLVGTTETPYQGDPGQASPTEQEIHYLLDAIKTRFPQAKQDIVSQFSGLRVLPAGKERHFLRARDTQFLNDDGLISVYGGKLTAYRATAEKLVTLVQKQLGKARPIADTRTLPLH